MSRESEVYGRIKSLSKMVVKGDVDPLNIDISTLVELFSKIDVERLPIELFMEDVDALNGLSLVLHYQKETIKRYLEGLKIDEMIVKTAILSLDIEALASIIDKLYRPPVDTSSIDNDFILESLLHFKNIERLRFEFTDKPVEIGSVDIPVEEDIRREMEVFHKRVLEESGGDWVRYGDLLGDKPILNSYLISLLASEGYLLIKVDRMSGEIFVKALDEKREFVNPISIPIVVSRGGYGEEA